MIPTFNRTRKFVREDYDTLISLLSSIKKFVTTPNILTEVSNLSAQMDKRLHADYFPLFAEGIARIDEHYVSSEDVSKMREFGWLHLTDAGIVSLAKREKYLVITVDFSLSRHLENEGVDVINFNQIRTSGWK